MRRLSLPLNSSPKITSDSCSSDPELDGPENVDGPESDGGYAHVDGPGSDGAYGLLDGPESDEAYGLFDPGPDDGAGGDWSSVGGRFKSVPKPPCGGSGLES